MARTPTGCPTLFTPNRLAMLILAVPAIAGAVTAFTAGRMSGGHAALTENPVPGFIFAAVWGASWGYALPALYLSARLISGAYSNPKDLPRGAKASSQQILQHLTNNAGFMFKVLAASVTVGIAIGAGLHYGLLGKNADSYENLPLREFVYGCFGAGCAALTVTFGLAARLFCCRPRGSDLITSTASVAFLGDQAGTHMGSFTARSPGDTSFAVGSPNETF